MNLNAVMIGGTGMLADAAREIAKRAERLTLISRSPDRLAREIGAEALPMDWTRAESVSTALAVLREQDAPNLMVSWIHDRGLWCLPDFEALLCPGARSIRVHGSAAGNPRNGIKTDPAKPGDILRQDVVLGWVNEPNGRRWLTDREISQGVLEAFDDPAKRAWIVGELR
jgi:hypothetical protein